MGAKRINTTLRDREAASVQAAGDGDALVSLVGHVNPVYSK